MDSLKHGWQDFKACMEFFLAQNQQEEEPEQQLPEIDNWEDDYEEVQQFNDPGRAEEIQQPEFEEIQEQETEEIQEQQLDQLMLRLKQQEGDTPKCRRLHRWGSESLLGDCQC